MCWIGSDDGRWVVATGIYQQEQLLEGREAIDSPLFGSLLNKFFASQVVSVVCDAVVP